MIRSWVGPRFVAACRAGAVAGVLAIAGAALAPAQQQGASQPQRAPVSSLSTPAATGADSLKASLDELEKSIAAARSEDELVVLKRRLATLRESIGERVAALDSQVKEGTRRVAELGAPPAPPATEDTAVAAERARLAAENGATEAALTAARSMANQAVELDRRVDQRRRDIFANQLLTRSVGWFDRSSWRDLADAMAAEARALASLMAIWIAYPRSNGGAGGALASAAVLALFGAAAWLAARRVHRLAVGAAPRRFDQARAALVILGFNAVMAPAVIGAIVLMLRNFGLMPNKVVEIGVSLAAASAVIGVGRGLAAALFAPGNAAARLIAFPDRAAPRCASHLMAAALAFGVAIFLNGLHAALDAPLAPIVATGEALAIVTLGIVIHFLWRSAPGPEGDDETGMAVGAESRRIAWLRGVLWIVAAALAIVLAAGYVGLAVFIATRVLATIGIAGAATVLAVFIDALLTDFLSPDTPPGRRIAALFGLTPRGLELVAMLLSATLRLALIVLAALLLIGSSGLFAGDVFGLIGSGTFSLAIGGISLSPLNVLSALVLAAIGVVAARTAQRWLQVQFLPRTGLDAGLQNSIAALFGYAALVAVFAFALGALGIDLQKVALIAGALSVGIGFGLQSVVSNFVCGLILLAERPIRVGDWIVVKNEEGWVRRISVRATEIETFDRASVIIPNQDFITGVVKNWTHGNTMGRIIIKVRVAYESDLAGVRETLLACAAADPRVLRTPPPTVYLMGFGDIGIDFELRCMLGDVEQSLGIRSDVQTAVLRKFAEAGIKIPFPGHEARPPGPPPPASPPSSVPAGPAAKEA